MSLHVFMHPGPWDSARCVEAEPRRPVLLVEMGGSGMQIRVPPQVDGFAVAAAYAEKLAKAAEEFAARCRELADGQNGDRARLRRAVERTCFDSHGMIFGGSDD
ncbi:hypothetical protein [Streptoalloteichus hindustanus]|uniref:Uncharacterized protein n=1 Tax=Streptoalloteichus hindustanus TaxID=2017 RepID=A0A1M5QHU5_STRHI|nr:hypothetical protein [Streptoalloteichus hindustanus]SHH13441.1 hypothetical protein SAMN05444320_1273 [Streptoalloteichus hindustanus]